MNLFLAAVFLFSLNAQPLLGDFNVISWNAKHLGRKSQDLKSSATLLMGADIIAIQEVNLGESGAKALAELAAILSMGGPKYCIGLSEIPTDARERYGILWREGALSYVTTKGEPIDKCPASAITLRLGAAGAEKIVRESAVGVFLEKVTGKKFHFITIHLVPTAKRPETEVGPLFETADGLPGKYPRIVLGDFNLPSDHPAFGSAHRLGYAPALDGEQKTSLRAKTSGMSKAYDNIWIKGGKLVESAVLNPMQMLPEKNQREIYKTISDHAPIKTRVILN